MTKQGTIKFYEDVSWKKIEEVVNGTPSIRKYIVLMHKYLVSNVKGNVLVLEIGCGNGDFIKEIANQVRKIVGVESSSKLLRDARKNLKTHRNVSFLHGEGETIKLPRNYFDYAICMWTLTNIDQPESLIKKMKNAVKKGGIIFIDTYSEKATKARIGMYKKYGLTVLGVTQDDIIVKEGLTEKIYTKEKLGKLFKKLDMNIEIIEMAKTGYLCKATKS